jgi:broad specificity phosphatase PhoE
LSKFLLVRHCTTEWVETQLLHGITDIPLNDKGRAQARETAQALKKCGAKNIYTSSLSRCVETADIIGKAMGVKSIPMDELVEIDFGWLEGKRIRDHDVENFGKLAEFLDHYFFNIIRMLSGESRRNLSKRVLLGWQKIQSENLDGTLIIVGHSGVFNIILLHLFGSTYLNGNTYHHLNPCSITEIEVDRKGISKLVLMNDRKHLSKENL